MSEFSLKTFIVNISDANGVRITVKGKWSLKCRRLETDNQDPFYVCLNLRTLFHAIYIDVDL
jgi:hypothetical protein